MTHFDIRPKVTQIIGLLLLSFALALPAVTTAQTRAQKSIITQLLRQSLLRCYAAPAERIGSDDEVILRVELNQSGDIANLPNIMSPVTMSKAERGLLREATVAVIDCTPIVSGGGEKSIYGRFDIVLNRDGLTLANVDAAVGRADVIPTLDSLAVTPTDSILVEITEPDGASEDNDQVDSANAAPETAPTVSVPTTKASEAAIGLIRVDRLEIQRRLDLLDYNTRGIDGVFGPGSRAAISAWQSDVGVPDTGYFDLNQIVLLQEMSQELYAKWEARPKRYYDRNGCLREPNGKIIKGRTFKCDLSAASQSIGISK